MANNTLKRLLGTRVLAQVRKIIVTSAFGLFEIFPLVTFYRFELFFKPDGPCIKSIGFKMATNFFVS